MKIKIQQFLRQNHSWSLVGWNIARELIKLNHDVHLIPTDQGDCLPKDLLPYVKNNIENNYDMQFSYTAPINFSSYLSYGKKNRFGMWCYEFIGTTNAQGKRLPVLPQGFAKHCLYPDKLLTPSQFTKNIFTDSGVPESKVKVLPHGIDLEVFKNKEKYNLQTKKTIKILANIAQVHLRKNLPGLLEVYGKAFSNKDDVCLVLKVSPKKILKHSFELNFSDALKDFTNKYPNHGKIEIIDTFIDDLVPLYNACDIIFTLSFCEGWWLPGTEGMAANRIVIAPNYGGQLEFMNNDNSILLGGKEIRADKKMMYWNGNNLAVVFSANIDDAVEKLRYAVYNYKSLLEKFEPKMKCTVENLTWEKIVKQLVDYCE